MLCSQLELLFYYLLRLVRAGNGPHYTTRGIKKPWSYPGAGLFPLSYLHGTGWSFYLDEPAPPSSDLNIEVYLLNDRPEKPYNATAEIPGQKLPVPFVESYLNAITFEPTGKKSPDPASTTCEFGVEVSASTTWSS